MNKKYVYDNTTLMELITLANNFQNSDTYRSDIWKTTVLLLPALLCMN